MSVLGFSINTLTLLSMVLAIGLVVDDAIVVLENIHRHIEDGMKPMKAAVVGIGEISSAVVAMTLTLAADYAPVAFALGRQGTLFAARPEKRRVGKERVGQCRSRGAADITKKKDDDNKPNK